MITEIRLEFYFMLLILIFYKPEKYFNVTITSTYSQSYITKVVQIVSHFNYLIDINKDQNLLIAQLARMCGCTWVGGQPSTTSFL